MHAPETEFEVNCNGIATCLVGNWASECSCFFAGDWDTHAFNRMA